MRAATALCLSVLAAAAIAAGGIADNERVSGTMQMSDDLRAMQANDAANPGMLSVLAGAALWQKKTEAGPSCQSCHGDAAQSMKGIAARYPAPDAGSSVIDLAGKIQQCQQQRQMTEPSARESTALLNLTAYLGFHSRNMPVAPPQGTAMDAARLKGRELFETKFGQLSLSCAQCHDALWGKRLGGVTIPQAHPTGYPIYRLEWQATGSLHRRFRNCLSGVRAEPFDSGSPELIALEAYLMDRARGMAIETPAVRP